MWLLGTGPSTVVIMTYNSFLPDFICLSCMVLAFDVRKLRYVLPSADRCTVSPVKVGILALMPALYRSIMSSRAFLPMRGIMCAGILTHASAIVCADMPLVACAMMSSVAMYRNIFIVIVFTLQI